MSDQCEYMTAAYPTLTGDDTCQTHRHEPRVFALAEALARSIHEEQTGDEQIGWLLDAADAVVDDFDPTPEAWEVSRWEMADGKDRGMGLIQTLTINGRAYVVQDSEWSPTPPVSREMWESWHEGEEQ